MLLIIISSIPIFAQENAAIELNEMKTSEVETTVANDPKNYPGSLNIPVNKLGLKGDALKGEELFAELLQLNPRLMEEIYDELPSTERGKILDVDIARKLFPPFDDGIKGANLYSNSTHVPASQFINFMFNEEIGEIINEKIHPEILFLAGGGGSGKDTVTAIFPKLYANVDLIIDGTLANFDKAKSRINFALDRGFKVTVVYIFRPIELAVDGIVSRAIKTGRAVPIVIAARDHFNAQKTVLRLAEELKEKINIIIISNTGIFMDAKVMKNIDELEQRGYSYESKDEVVLRAIGAYLDFISKMDPKLKKDLAPELKAVFEKDMNTSVSNFVERFKQEVAVPEPSIL